MTARMIAALTCLALLLPVVAIADDTDTRLVGSWVGAKGNVSLVYTFAGDGTGSFGMGTAERTIDVPITWKVVESEGDVLRIAFTTKHGKSDEIEFVFVDADNVSFLPMGSRPNEQPITMSRKK